MLVEVEVEVELELELEFEFGEVSQIGRQQELSNEHDTDTRYFHPAIINSCQNYLVICKARL